MTKKFEFFLDQETNHVILQVGTEVVVMTMSEWSNMIAHPIPTRGYYKPENATAEWARRRR